jgi:serine-type D-Ala-D-Ala carboxypeptidase (penicillin-binding protein 5/6)
MKRIWLSYAITVLLLGCFATLVYWIQSPSFQLPMQEISTPLPSFLFLHNNKQVSTLTLWLPVLGEKDVLQKPNITGKAAIAFDVLTNKTLFTKNEKQRFPMASLTKVMTAIVALENKLPTDKYIVPKEALVGEDSMGLTSSETLSLNELLYGLLLVSGNDAAEVLAYNYALGRDGFVDAMNKKSQALGLTNTHFTNPTGLQGDGDQYTTAYDLLVITRYAMETFPEFRKVVATLETTIDQTATHSHYYLSNETNLLRSYPGVKGVKTGYTPEANLCLITYLEYKDHKIIAVLLGSDNRRIDMKEVLDYSLKSLGITPPQASL